MKPCIRKIDPASEYFFKEGCHIIEISNSDQEPELSIARARVEPGISTRWHSLRGVSERYIIISGTGLVEIGYLAPSEVRAGDVVVIPPMCRQRITNIGKEDLVFFAVCTPRFRSELYDDLENGI